MLAAMRSRTAELVAAVEDLVSVESPSNDPAALQRCAERAGELGGRLLGAAPERPDPGGVPALVWRFGRPRVLLLGHLDTVWPLGTVDRWPFAVRDGRASGPGVVDMKGGIVQGLFALSALDDLDGVMVLWTSDEELGSPASRDLIVSSAEGLEAALVLESGLDRALKVGRKGVGRFELCCEGRAAHAGLEPQAGANALVALAGLVRTAVGLADPARGTTVVPTLASAGTAGNVVPARAALTLDVRALEAAESERVDRAVRGLEPDVEGVRLVVEGGFHRPPLELSASAALFARARRVGEQLGLGTLDGAVVGGGSDGNLTAAAGTPTLDGLGAVGGRAHAEGEFLLVDALPERAALLAALLRDLLTDPLVIEAEN